MYRIGPLDRLRAVTQRLEREGGYWINQVTRLVPGARSRRPQSMDLDNFKGSPVLLVAVGCTVLLCLCAASAVGILGLLLIIRG